MPEPGQAISAKPKVITPRAPPSPKTLGAASLVAPTAAKLAAAQAARELAGAEAERERVAQSWALIEKRLQARQPEPIAINGDARGYLLQITRYLGHGAAETVDLIRHLELAEATLLLGVRQTGETARITKERSGLTLPAPGTVYLGDSDPGLPKWARDRHDAARLRGAAKGGRGAQAGAAV